MLAGPAAATLPRHKSGLSQDRPRQASSTDLLQIERGSCEAGCIEDAALQRKSLGVGECGSRKPRHKSLLPHDVRSLFMERQLLSRMCLNDLEDLTLLFPAASADSHVLMLLHTCCVEGRNGMIRPSERSVLLLCSPGAVLRQDSHVNIPGGERGTE